MHILMTGGTGFIGSRLVERFTSQGYSLTVLSRRSQPGSPAVAYIESLDRVDAGAEFDAVINLAGASLADYRWTARYKREILASRLDTTRQLLETMGRLERAPATLLSASAIGYYGHHGDEILDEDGTSNPGFAQDLCSQWEALALEAGGLGTRVCLMRLGVVLDAGGGAFAQMARPFRMGVANWLGDGRQWLSWIQREDVIAAVEFLLQQDYLTGPFNLTAPGPVTSREFCEAMKRHHRTLVTAPVPASVMRLLVGEMADELLLHGQRVVPSALQAAGFEFRYPALDDALAAIC